MESSNLTEYKSLRDEIIALMNRRSQRLTVTFTGLTALFAATYVAKMPELAPLGMLLVGSGWSDDHRQREQIIRIGLYNKYFIEPFQDSVNWETRFSEVLNLERSESGSRKVEDLDNIEGITRLEKLKLKLKSLRTSVVKDLSKYQVFLKTRALIIRHKPNLFSNYGSAFAVSLFFSIYMLVNSPIEGTMAWGLYILIFLFCLQSSIEAYKRGMKYTEFAQNTHDRIKSVAETEFEKQKSA
ncbi:TPA: hypothetical protein ACGUXQ_004360 [Vibrio vulnificus]